VTISVFNDGDELYAAMLDSIRRARSAILLETYIFVADEVGERFVEALADRARDGLDVRLLVDAFGSLRVLPRAVQRRLKSNGVRVRRFHRWQWRSPLRYNRRDHRKLLVVDGREAYLGGFNIHRESSRRYSGDACWRDTHVRVDGALAEQAQVLFETFWRNRRRRHLPVVWHGGSALLSNHNRYARRRMRRTFDEIIGAARERVWLTNPYFVPDATMQRRLIEAARRGSDVRILVPGTIDVRLVRWASHAAYSRLLAHGVRIFEYQPRLLHAKTMLVDDEWAVVGTSNLDYRSLRHNYEINLVSSDPELRAALAAQHLQDLTHAHEILPDTWERRHSLHYIAEAIGWAARRWL
jgi:cardiolipin synthase A/B